VAEFSDTYNRNFKALMDLRETAIKSTASKIIELYTSRSINSLPLATMR
jgi:hypothetical protein